MYTYFQNIQDRLYVITVTRYSSIMTRRI